MTQPKKIQLILATWFLTTTISIVAVTFIYAYMNLIVVRMIMIPILVFILPIVITLAVGYYLFNKKPDSDIESEKK